jgi:hypothetical protein
VLKVKGRQRQSASTLGPKTHRIDCDIVLLHQGVVPNTQISRSLRFEHRWNALQRCFAPVADAWGALDGRYYVAGDGGGIGGAKAAELQGRLAALHAAAELEALSAPVCATK